MITPVKKLTRRQEALLLALFEEPTITRAAKRAKVSEVQAHRWLKEETFQSEYRQARVRIFDQTIVDLQRLAVSAVAALARNLKADAPPHVQVQAAKVVLEHAKEGADLQELLERVKRLEELSEAPAIFPRRLA